MIIVQVQPVQKPRLRPWKMEANYENPGTLLLLVQEQLGEFIVAFIINNCFNLVVPVSAAILFSDQIKSQRVFHNFI